MDVSAVTQLVAMRAASTQQSAMIAIVRKNHEMEMSLLQMLDQTARAAPPAGQGRQVDRLA
jgi:hypothetical protein